jgi:hypothetical protein
VFGQIIASGGDWRVRARRHHPERSEGPLRPLFDFDNRSGFSELLLDGLGFVLRDTFLDALGSAIHQVFCLFQAKAGDFAYRLDYIDLIGSNFF